MLMKLVPSVVLASAIAVAPTFLSKVMVDGAALAWEGIGEYKVLSTCEEMMDDFIFTGDCCSLQETDSGECTVVTTTECYFQVEGDTGCTTMEDGSVACVDPGVQMTSNSGEACPDSDYEIVLLEVEEYRELQANETTTPPAESPVSAPTDREPVPPPSAAGARLLLNLSPLMVAGTALLFA